MTSVIYFHVNQFRLPVNADAHAIAWIGNATPLRMTPEQANVLELECRERHEQCRVTFVEHPHRVEYLDGEDLVAVIDCKELVDALDVCSKAAYVPAAWITTAPVAGWIRVTHNGYKMKEVGFTDYRQFKDLSFTYKR